MAGIYTDVRQAARKGIIPALLDFFPDQTSQNNGIIFSHLNAPEPSQSYVVINILSIPQLGRSTTSTLTNEDLELSLGGVYEVLVQYSFIGNLSGDMAHTFYHNISSNPFVFEELRKYGLSYFRKSQIRRAPQKREAQWVEYNNVDVTYNYIVNQQQEVDVVENVILQDAITGDIFTIPPDVVINP